MKPTRFLPPVLFLLFSVNSFSQFDNFKLSDYRLPDIKTHLLDFSAYLNNNAYHLEMQNDLYEPDTLSSKSLGGLFNFRYRFFRNSVRYQGSLEAYLNSGADYSDLSAPGNKTKTSNIPVSISFNSKNRFYTSERFFIGLDPYLSQNISIRNEHDPDQNDRTRTWKSNQTSIDLPFYIGVGRIEPVENARHAVYVLQQLEKDDRLKKVPSNEQIVEFARLISKLKNKRIFDSRLREIEELHAVDSFLLSNDLVKESDITYYAGLNDIWDYGYGPARNTGRVISGGIRYYLNFSQENFEEITDGSSNENSSLYRNNTLGLFLQYQHSKPVNLSWQSDLYVKTGYDYEISSIPFESAMMLPGVNTNILKGSVNYSVSYIPNTRTQISLGAGSVFKDLSGERELAAPQGPVPGKMKGFDLSFTGLASIVYYFSPQLTLNANWNFYYQWFDTWSDFDDGTSIENLRKGFNHSLYISLTYSIF